MLSEDEIHELEILAHLEEKDFNNNTYDKTYIDLVMNAGKKSFKIITKLQKENKKYIDIISHKIIDVLKDELVQLKNKELDLKDKQIDLMVEAFKQDDIRSKEEIKQYFEKLAKGKGE